MDRLAMLERMVVERPDDPFPRYGQAMELRKLGRQEDAWEAFQKLMEAHPNYVPCYLMAGNLLADLGRSDQARSIYERGIEVAQRAGDDHTVGEIQAALGELK